MHDPGIPGSAFVYLGVQGACPLSNFFLKYEHNQRFHLFKGVKPFFIPVKAGIS